MKTARFTVLAATVATITICCSLRAAPVESVESACASPSFQKVSAFLSEKAVADQLTALGLSQEQAQVRLAALSDTQLDQLAAQVELIRAGGTIQGTSQGRMGPFGCWFKQLGDFLHDVFDFLFCWSEPR